MVNNEKIDKLVQLYEDSNGFNITSVINGIGKNYGSCDLMIRTNSEVVNLELDDEDIKIYKSNIKDVRFSEISKDLIISIIELNNGDTISIHNHLY